MKTVQLTNNPPTPEFKGVSVSIDPDKKLALKFYQVTREEGDTMFAEVTSSIGMSKDQWESLKQIVDGEIKDAAANKNQ